MLQTILPEYRSAHIVRNIGKKYLKKENPLKIILRLKWRFIANASNAKSALLKH